MAAKDWSHLRLPEDKLKTLETMLDASRKDHQRTMDALDEYADLAVSDLFDFDHPDKSLALTDPDAIVEAARNIVQVAQEAADNRYDVQRQAWQQAAGREFPEYALPDREDWTRVMWDVQKGFSNTDYNGLTYGQVMAGKARSGVTIMDLLPKTAGMGIDDMQQAYADFFCSLAAHAAQRRQMADIAGDPTKPRWARVPRGSVTCAFCTMLAGRGFVYTSEDAAGGGLGNAYHAHCDCEPVPTWGEAKLTGYDPDKLNAIYLQAKAQAPDGASYRDVLSHMRANGGVADSPATQAGPGGGGGKPPKPPKAASGAEEPEEPNGDKNGHEPQLQNNEAINKCHEAVVRGNGVDLYDQAVSNGFSGSREDWASDLISKEIAERDSEWIESSGRIIPRAKYESKRAKRELKPHEKKTLQTLLDNGFGVTVQERSNVEGARTADSLINVLKVDLKSPQGNYSSLDKLLQRAGKQGDAVVVDLQARTNRVTDETAIANIPKSLARRKLRYALLITHDGQLIRLYPDDR